MEVGNRAAGDDVVGVIDQAEAARAAVGEGEEAAAADGGSGTGEDRGGATCIETGERQGAGVDRDATRESVVVAEDEGAETCLGEAVGISRIIEQHVEGQRRLRGVHGDGGVAGQGSRDVVALKGEAVGAFEGDLRAGKGDGVTQSVRPGRSQVGARRADG